MLLNNHGVEFKGVRNVGDIFVHDVMFLCKKYRNIMIVCLILTANSAQSYGVIIAVEIYNMKNDYDIRNL